MCLVVIIFEVLLVKMLSPINSIRHSPSIFIVQLFDNMKKPKALPPSLSDGRAEAFGIPDRSLKTFGLYPDPMEKTVITSYGLVENDSDLVHGLLEVEGALSYVFANIIIRYVLYMLI